MRRIPVALAVLLVLPAVLHAGSSRVGTSSAAFLQVPVGPRNIALGEAYSAIGADPFVVWGQPAVWATGEGHPAVAFQHNDFFLDLEQQYLAGYGAVWGGGLGVAVTRFDAGDLLRTFEDATGDFAGSSGTFDAGDWAVAVGYGRRWTDRWTVGITGKVIRSEIDNVDATTFGVDLGGRYEYSDRLTLGIAVTNIGRGQRFLRARDPLPLTVRAGGAYRLGNRLVAAIDLVQPRDHAFETHVGIEWRPIRALALRVGYSQARDEDNREGLTAGVGVHIGDFALDYAYVPFGLLGDSHRIGVTYHFRGVPEEWAEVSSLGAPAPRVVRTAAAPAPSAAPAASPTTLRSLSWGEPGYYGEYFGRYSQLR